MQESHSAFFLFIHYSVPTSLFAVNRVTSKKSCTSPGLGLPSNVKSSLYVTYREGGAFIIISRESSRIPTTASLCSTVFNIYHLKIRTEKIFYENSWFRGQVPIFLSPFTHLSVFATFKSIMLKHPPSSQVVYDIKGSHTGVALYSSLLKCDTLCNQVSGSQCFEKDTVPQSCD